ncbi:Hypothetical protein CINCED_3A018339, partial [Cinara cedri]
MELGGTETKDDTIEKEITELNKETIIEFDKIKGDKDILKKLTDKIKSPDDKQLHIDNGEDITTIITKVTETHKTKLQRTDNKEITDQKKETMIEMEKIKGDKDIQKKLTDKIKSPDDKQLHIDHGEEITTIITKVTETHKTKLQRTDSDLIGETLTTSEIQKPTDETPSPMDKDPLKESKIHEISQGYKGEGDEIIKHKIPIDKSFADIIKSPATDTIKAEI